ncbi:MAG: ATP-binding protein, partial [Bradymonadaceae bacterium]|nr:ATP-binding protein [Lujinxingiaceae bacterium]
MSIENNTSLDHLMRELKLPGMRARHQELAHTAERQGWSFAQYLHQLAEGELEGRQARRIERLLASSKLPSEKSLRMLELGRFDAQVRRRLPVLCEGHFVKRGENVLVFGLPGRGKTHLVCAIGHELIRKGFAVRFSPTFRLVEHLLAARRDYRLEAELKALDHYDVVILDDLGYVQQSREEMEVLFTFLAQRYERKSVMITSNLVFSQWDQIFKDPMTTAAAIDRLVHHATIVELTGESYRNEMAQQRQSQQALQTEPAD